MGKKTAKKVERAKTFVELTHDSIQHELDEAVKQLTWQLTQGGGYYNIHFLDTLRSVHMGCLRLAAHKDAVRSLKIELREARV